MNAKHDLAEALCQLLETKTLEKITVKDIVARCGVNRQTFYYHFHDVYDLMRWIFEREAANLAQTVRDAGGDWRQELHTITDVLRSKRHLVINAYRSVNRRDLERYLMQGYGPVIRRIVDQAAVGLDVGQEDLENSGSANTTDAMREAVAYEYRLWDAELNQIYQAIMAVLPDEETDTLRGLERRWIRERDTAAKQAAERYKGGTMENVEYTASLANSTRDRAYELLDLYESYLPAE